MEYITNTADPRPDRSPHLNQGREGGGDRARKKILLRRPGDGGGGGGGSSFLPKNILREFPGTWEGIALMNILFSKRALTKW